MKERKSRYSFKKCLFIAGALIVVVIGFMIWLLWPKDEVYDPPLPLMLPENLEIAYESIAQDQGHNSVLLLYGQHGKGKSRSLHEFVDQERKAGHLVFYFDFGSLSPYSNEREALQFIHQSILQSIISREGWASYSNSIKSAIQHLADGVSHFDLGADYNAYNDPNHLLSIKSRQVQKLYDTFNKIGFGLYTRPAVALSLLYHSFPTFSSMSPIVVISNPERFKAINFTQTPDFYDLFMHNFCSASSHLPRVVEISDYHFFSKIQTIPQNQFPFVPIYVGDFSQEKAKQLLSRVFKQSQQSLLFREFGGHGAAFVQVHELMRDGISFDSSVKQVLGAYQKKVRAAPMDEIKTLAKGEKVTYVQVPTLVELGIAGPSDLTHVSFSNKAYLRYAQKLIKQASQPSNQPVNATTQ